MIPEPLRAQIQLGDCDHLRKLAETLDWQQQALLASNFPAATRTPVAARATKSPMPSVAR